MAELHSILSSLLRLPEDQIFPVGTDTSQYYQHWGFTIYRTDYTPSSQTHWKALIDKIHSQVVDEVSLRRGPDPDNDPEVELLLSLFRLDTRSDESTFADKSIDHVRHTYEDAIGGSPMHYSSRQMRYFLLADSEVLSDVAEGVYNVKFVEADYKVEDHVPRNWRAGPQRYFGWMEITTRSLLELWEILANSDLQRIAPRTIGGESFGGLGWGDEYVIYSRQETI